MKTIIAIFLFSPSLLFAQGGPEPRESMVGVYGVSSIPSGEFENVAEMGYGGGVRFQYGLSKLSGFTASSAWIIWQDKKIAPGTNVENRALQILLGGKFYAAGGLYVSGELGLNFLKVTVRRDPGFPPGSSASRARFAVPLGIGYQIVGLEASAKFFIVNASYQNFAFSLGYNIQL